MAYVPQWSLDDIKSYLTHYTSGVPTTSMIEQLFFGAFTGYSTGYLVSKTSMPLAISFGITIIVAQVIITRGFFGIDESRMVKIREDAQTAFPWVVNQLKNIGHHFEHNSYFAMAFGGGLVLGLIVT